MLCFAKCLEALFRISSPECQFTLHTKYWRIQAFDNCDPYNLESSEHQEGSHVYRHIFNDAWMKFKPQSGPRKPETIEVYRGKDLHDRSVT